MVSRLQTQFFLYNKINFALAPEPLYLRFRSSMKQFIILFLLVFFWIACGDVSKEDESPLIAAQDTIRYGQERMAFPSLTQSAKEQIENWSVYDDFFAEASTLNKINLSNLRIKTQKLLARTDSLSKKIPDTLYTNAIFSRLVIIKTRIELLNQEVNRTVVDSEKIETNISETQEAVRNLIVQLNEKFQKDRIDLQRIDDEKKELEKQKKFLDSVYQAELKDQQTKNNNQQ